MRRISPTRIVFDRVVVHGWDEWPPLYIGDGVTRAQLINSELAGSSENIAIYIDAESARNMIRNNYIHTETTREVIAVDAPSHNLIVNNWLSGLSRGGIYLYRNCGENGTIRDATPHRNVIVNNVFFYRKYSPSAESVNPAVFLSSRNGNRSYCGDDEHPRSRLGSSASDLDYAADNAVV